MEQINRNNLPSGEDPLSKRDHLRSELATAEAGVTSAKQYLVTLQGKNKTGTVENSIDQTNQRLERAEARVEKITAELAVVEEQLRQKTLSPADRIEKRSNVENKSSSSSKPPVKHVLGGLMLIIIIGALVLVFGLWVVDTIDFTEDIDTAAQNTEEAAADLAVVVQPGQTVTVTGYFNEDGDFVAVSMGDPYDTEDQALAVRREITIVLIDQSPPECFGCVDVLVVNSNPE